MNIRDHRRKVLRETLQKVSNRCGIDVSVLSRMECRGKANDLRVPELAKGYRLTIEAFEKMLGGSSENKNKRVRNARRVSPRNPSASST